MQGVHGKEEIELGSLGSTMLYLTLLKPALNWVPV